MRLNDAYEIVIGLEVHVELATKSKLFCSCPTTFGAPPNTQVCPVCAGLPGALPTLNRRAVELLALTGLALGCSVSEKSEMARKNYFYPDLPKAYQISQASRPLCAGGSLTIDTPQGEKRIGITRIHLEEDAGKLIHDPSLGTMLDCNRCGVPLMEIVSEPDLRSPEEARSYLQALRTVILYTGASRCRMNEGAFRCDVNLSVRKRGNTALGTRTELKNLNSFAFVAKAIEYEAARQIALLETGGRVRQETRRFDPDTGKTYAMRSKENATDYRYFPEPDLPLVFLPGERIDALRASLPPLPRVRRGRYVSRLGLSPQDAEQLTAQREIADYFEAAAAYTPYPKLLANLIIAELIPFCGEPFRSPVSPENMAELATLCGEQTVNSSTAKAVAAQLRETDESPRRLVKRQGLEQINDRTLLAEITQTVLEQNPKSVADFKNGKTNAAKALIGQVMKETRGKANPVLATELMLSALEER